MHGCTVSMPQQHIPINYLGTRFSDANIAPPYSVSCITAINDSTTHSQLKNHRPDLGNTVIATPSLVTLE